jgi:putative flippase GtrA
MLIETKLYNAIRSVYSRQRKLVLYALIGLFSASIDFLVFTILVKYFDFFISNIMSVTFGITSSFILNRNLNFRLKDKTAMRALSLFIVVLTGMFLSTLILGLLILILPINILLLKIISAFFVVLMQFFMNKLFTFK